MKWVILAVRDGTTLEDFRSALSPQFRTLVSEESRSITTRSESDIHSYVCIHHCSDEAVSYDEPHELEALRAFSDNPQFYLANYCEIDFLRDVLSQLVQGVEMIIDDDYGIIEDGKAFCSRWLENPDWDFVAEFARKGSGMQE